MSVGECYHSVVGFCEVSSGHSFDRPPSSHVASRLRNSKTKPTDEVRFFDRSAGPCCDRPQLPRVRRAPRSIVKIGGKIGFQNASWIRSNRPRVRCFDREFHRHAIAVESG